ncbi:ATPase AAA [Bifidobacterium sp. DSM 109957]|uniref:ATPase AAA n=1 Tax=Bifidobacterium oedipodis TaxID=2675322 RepID=A0A7Y0EP18_9BIFI|nr:ATPase AAA [Bifidobacterium sp. DSM 109957]
MPALALALMIALACAAMLVSVITRNHVALDDGTVWITSLANGKAARFNVRNRQTDATISSSASRFDILQHGAGTVLIEPNKASSIKASTVAFDGESSLSNGISCAMGGTTIACINPRSGNVWTGTVDAMETMSPSRDAPRIRLGDDGRIAVTHTGHVYGYRPADGTVLLVDGHRVRSTTTIASLSNGNRQPADSFTVVSGTPAITSGNEIILASGRLSIDTQDSLVLQNPPIDDMQSGWLAAVSSQGVAVVDLARPATPTIEFLLSGHSADPAQPVSANGCVHAAFSQSAHNYIRLCSPDIHEASFQTLKSITPTSALVFRANHRQVVLNDVTDGDVWHPEESSDTIAIQWNHTPDNQADDGNAQSDSAQTSGEFAQTCSQSSAPISAEDDAFGVRSGSALILDVLRNDQQSDCSVLRISAVGAPSNPDVRIMPIYHGRYLQMDAFAASSGEVRFTYDITDGRGQSDTANVTVTLSSTGNQAPAQFDIPPEISVEQAASVSYNILGGFADPDGDAMTLASATVLNTDQAQVSVRADGKLTFHSAAMTSGRASVQVVVSDGQLTGTGMVYFTVKPADTLPALLDPILVAAPPNTDVTVDLSAYVHATSAQQVQLTSVSPPDGVTADMKQASMTITVRAANHGTHYVAYTVAQGTIPATGLIRFEAQPSSGQAAKPVTANDVALLDADGNAIVEPLSNDVDPLGGALALVSADVPADCAIRVALAERRRVIITARQLPEQPVTLTYTAANAAGNTTGVIVVHPPALVVSDNALQARDITLSVRTGGIVSADVLDYVAGDDVRLDSSLSIDETQFRGLVFVSGNTVRYQAGDEAGVFRAIYTVRDGYGNTSSATIEFNVHQRDAEHKTPPTPHPVTAQVAAGYTVRIDIPLTGIDTDGDDVQLLGLGNIAPQLGRISEVGSDYLLYEAYPDSSGTDSFSYAVEDWVGQRAQANISVAVFQSTASTGLLARDDTVELRPNTTATVPVLQNDIYPQGSNVSLANRLESHGIDKVRVQGDALVFVTPANAATAYIVYSITDQAGLSDQATLTVNVVPDAIIEPPTAHDYRVPAVATIDKTSVDVDVSPWIANPSGSQDELQVEIHPSASLGARINDSSNPTIITVDLAEQARAVPYTVTNTTYGLSSTAFIHVPAYGVFPPVLRPKAPALLVNSRDTITININDYVRVGAGKTPCIEQSSVSATKSANLDWYVNETTLRFTAVNDYAGPASITFTVTDAPAHTRGNAIVNTATLSLPITIIGRVIPPPIFSSPIIDVEVGSRDVTVDLAALTRAPVGVYADERQYSYETGTPTSSQITVETKKSGMLRISSRPDAIAGTMVSIPIAIHYGAHTLDAGLTVRIVASSQPLPRVAAKSVRLQAGSQETVDILEDAFNPFEDTPLTVTGCIADDNARFTVNCPSSGRITINAKADIGASANRILVNVRDATGTQDRQVTGIITVTVIDKPASPLLSPVTEEPQNSTVTLHWTAASSNGSPILEYRVDWTGYESGSQSCGTATSCIITGLTNGQRYTFTVTARNEVGWSAPSAAVIAMPDATPSAPTQVSITASLLTATVSWHAPTGNASLADLYEVTLTGVGDTQTKQTSDTSARFALNNTDMRDGITVTATVRARNQVGWSAVSVPAAPTPVWGNPEAPTLNVTNDDTLVTVTASATNTRNAGCESITIEGEQIRDTVACARGSTSFTIDESLLNTATLTFTARMNPKREATSPTSKPVSFRPTYAIQSPGNVYTIGSGNTCTVHWTKRGRAQQFIVSADGFDGPVTVSGNSYGFVMAPWSTCTGGEVTQVFNGTASTAIRGGPRNGAPYVYKVTAHIVSPLALTWHETNPNIIIVGGGSVNTYGQPATIRITINGRAFAWQGSTLDVSGLPFAEDGTYRWQVSVTGSDPALNAVSGTGAVAGTRYVPEPVTPPEEGDPDESETE